MDTFAKIEVVRVRAGQHFSLGWDDQILLAVHDVGVGDGEKRSDHYVALTILRRGV